jgi:hypothetical protein
MTSYSLTISHKLISSTTNTVDVPEPTYTGTNPDYTIYSTGLTLGSLFENLSPTVGNSDSISDKVVKYGEDDFCVKEYDKITFTILSDSITKITIQIADDGTMDDSEFTKLYDQIKININSIFNELDGSFSRTFDNISINVDSLDKFLKFISVDAHPQSNNDKHVSCFLKNTIVTGDSSTVIDLITLAGDATHVDIGTSFKEYLKKPEGKSALKTMLKHIIYTNDNPALGLNTPFDLYVNTEINYLDGLAASNSTPLIKFQSTDQLVEEA